MVETGERPGSAAGQAGQVLHEGIRKPSKQGVDALTEGADLAQNPLNTRHRVAGIDTGQGEEDDHGQNREDGPKENLCHIHKFDLQVERRVQLRFLFLALFYPMKSFLPQFPQQGGSGLNWMPVK